MSSLKASLDSGEYNDENELDEVIIDKKNTQKISNCGTIHQVDIISCMGYSMEPHIMESDLCIIAIDIIYKDGSIMLSIHQMDL